MLGSIKNGFLEGLLESVEGRSRPDIEKNFAFL